MRFAGWIFVGCCLASAATFLFAQPPIRPDRGGSNSSGDAASFIERLLKLDANGDGQLSKDEVTDSRLTALFDRADTDHNGIVTRDELTALFRKEASSLRQGGPDGRFGPGGGGPGGPDGPGGLGGYGPPPLGQVLPPPVQDMLQLTDEQRQKVDELQKQVDASLAKILRDEQKQQLEELRSRRPGGPGGPGGPGRGAGGPPPGGR